MPSIRASKQPLVVHASMIYLMLGGLLAAWGGFWLIDEIDRDAPHKGVYVVCVGLMMVGLGLVWVGLRMGRIILTPTTVAEEVEEQETTQFADEDPVIRRKI